MRPAEPDRFDGAHRLVRTAWAALPLATALCVVLRSAPQTRTWAQLLFLTPIVIAVVLLWQAGGLCQHGSRARWRWRLFAAAAGCALIGEAALSARTLGLVGDRAPADVVFEVAAVAGAGFLVAAAVLTTGGGVSRQRRVRRLLDGVAITALLFALVFRVVGERYYARQADLGKAIAMTVAILVGILLLQLGTLILTDMRARRTPSYPALAGAVGLLGVATVLWAASEMAAPGSGGSAVATASAVLSFVAYYLLMIGAMQRVLLPIAVFGRGRGGSRPSARRSFSELRAGLVLTALASSSVAWLIWFAFAAPASSSARSVYTAALTIGSLALVGRTWLSSAEVARLDDTVLVDPMTGAYGPRALGTAWDAVRGSAAQQGLLPTISLLDVDALVRANAAAGYSAGDRRLQEAAVALENAAGSHAWVLRVAGDEFAVLSVSATVAGARTTGERLVAAVRGVRGEPALTASVGVAVARCEEIDGNAVLRRARVACAWAKRCGGARAVVWEPRLARLVSVDERLATAAYIDEGVARALLDALAARDPIASGHAHNVAALSRLLAEEIGCPDEHVERIELAALLHDVGAIAVPDVLQESRRDADGGTRAVREHCTLGQRLVAALGDEELGAWVRSHHERWDGLGQPDGLAGGSIPLEARIIALANVYDRLTASRRYGAPLSRAAALQEIDIGLGSRFDPELGERFIVLVGTMPGLGPSNGGGIL